MGDSPEWLPEGWKVNVRVRSSGKRDKYYVDPSDGHRFNSKPEVLRFLENARKNHKPKKLNMVDKNTNIDIKKTVAEKLPEGWIKKIQTTKKGGKTRRDPYYIDPVSGRHFRSMQEVFRYLGIKDSKKVESMSDDKDNPQSSSTGANEKRLIKKIDDKNITGNKSLKSDLIGSVTTNVNIPENNHLKEGEEEDDSLAVEHSDKIQLVKGVENDGEIKREHKNFTDNEVDKNVVDGDQILNSGSNCSGTENMADNLPSDLPLVIGTVKDDSRTSQNKRKKQTSQLPRRTSKRLSRTDNDSSVEIVSAELDDAGINLTGKIGNGPENSTNDKQKDPADKKSESSLNDLLMDPCIEFAIKTLTGAIPIEDTNKVEAANQIPGSSSALPPGDLWSDPCFEFAVKMLTGDIPVEESFSYSKCSNLTLPESRSQNSIPPSFSYSHFNAVENPTAKNGGKFYQM